jgi:tRNA threonylcarbamoyl adenosine modification protein YeaZ
MLILAFDTATDVATSALVADGDVLGERVSAPRCLLQDVDELLRSARLEPTALDALVVGTGPGSFTSTRIGLAIARGLAIALGIPVAGISTLDALGSGTDNGYPVIDARRGEVFVRGPRAVHPDDLELEPGAVCIGSGAVRYRPAFEREGALVPPDDDPVHLPSARLHASLAHAFGPADDLLPIYGRAPDAQVRSAA